MTIEKRRHPRIHFKGTVFVELNSPGGSQDAMEDIRLCETLDISAGGLALSIYEQLTVDTILPIGVELYEEEDILHLTGRVAWCLPDPDTADLWRAGFEILNSNDSDIQAWRAVINAMDEED